LRDETERKDRQIPEFAKRQEATAERTKAQQRLDRLLAHPTTGRFGLSPDDPRSRRAQRDLDRLNAEVARVNATYEATTKAWRASAALLAHIERSLRERPGGTQNDLV